MCLGQDYNLIRKKSEVTRSVQSNKNMSLTVKKKGGVFSDF